MTSIMDLIREVEGEQRAPQPRKPVKLNPDKKDAFAIGVSADNYHFITKLADANGTNRTHELNRILDGYTKSLLQRPL